MKNVRKLKAKIKCNCNDHYIELLSTFDGDTYTYMKCCTKCGRWWTDISSEYVHEYDETSIYDTRNHCICTFKAPRVIQTEHAVIFDDGHGYRDVYLKYSDGTLSELLRRETY